MSCQPCSDGALVTLSDCVHVAQHFSKCNRKLVRSGTFRICQPVDINDMVKVVSLAAASCSHTPLSRLKNAGGRMGYSYHAVGLLGVSYVHGTIPTNTCASRLLPRFATSSDPCATWSYAALPTSLSALQRRQVHGWAMQLALFHASSGEDTQRHVIISKTGEAFTDGSSPCSV